ncbi:hypothetical protein TorRG33x02_225870, partial [Trema orientale]
MRERSPDAIIELSSSSLDPFIRVLFTCYREKKRELEKMVKSTNPGYLKNIEQVESDPILKEIDDFEEDEIISSRQELSKRDQSSSSGDIPLSEQEAWSAKNATSKFTARKYESKITSNNLSELGFNGPSTKEIGYMYELKSSSGSIGYYYLK